MNQNSDSQDIQDRIQIEIFRVKIQNHPMFSKWYGALKPYGKLTFDFMMENDITPELVLASQDSPEDEWRDFQFLRIVGGAQPGFMLASTSYVLSDILDELEELSRQENSL
jgi:hypothetical protein